LVPFQFQSYKYAAPTALKNSAWHFGRAGNPLAAANVVESFIFESAQVGAHGVTRPT
jgi:hypothetical protein